MLSPLVLFGAPGTTFRLHLTAAGLAGGASLFVRIEPCRALETFSTQARFPRRQCSDALSSSNPQCDVLKLSVRRRSAPQVMTCGCVPNAVPVSSQSSASSSGGGAASAAGGPPARSGCECARGYTATTPAGASAPASCEPVPPPASSESLVIAVVPAVVIGTTALACFAALLAWWCCGGGAAGDEHSALTAQFILDEADFRVLEQDPDGRLRVEPNPLPDALLSPTAHVTYRGNRVLLRLIDKKRQGLPGGGDRSDVPDGSSSIPNQRDSISSIAAKRNTSETGFEPPGSDALLPSMEGAATAGGSFAVGATLVVPGDGGAAAVVTTAAHEAQRPAWDGAHPAAGAASGARAAHTWAEPAPGRSSVTSGVSAWDAARVGSAPRRRSSVGASGGGGIAGAVARATSRLSAVRRTARASQQRGLASAARVDWELSNLKAVASLRHPSVVAVFGASSVCGKQVLVEEYMSYGAPRSTRQTRLCFRRSLRIAVESHRACPSLRLPTAGNLSGLLTVTAVPIELETATRMAISIAMAGEYLQEQQPPIAAVLHPDRILVNEFFVAKARLAVTSLLL